MSPSLEKAPAALLAPADEAHTYIAPAWLPGGHLQTLYPAFCIAKPQLAFRRERWDTPDGDFIDVDFVDGQPGQPFLVLFHGIESSSDSQYSRALMAHIARLGWSGAVPHFRSCSGDINRAPRLYFSGDSAEIDWILRRMKPYAEGRNASRLYAAGVSLGGNAFLRWLGESQHQADFVDAACAISAPLDLAACGYKLGRGFSLIYTRNFLQSLKRKCVQKLRQYPGLFDRETMLAARNFYEFDNVVTAPLHGYKNSEDYWDRASARHVLSHITVPTLVMNAKNDPFLPREFLPQHAAAGVTLDFPEHGGHVGFATGPFPGNIDWLPRRIVRFLQGDHSPVA